MSALTFCTIASGTPIGAISAFQPIDTKPGTDSATVGMFGKFGSRPFDVTAIGLTWPDAIVPSSAA